MPTTHGTGTLAVRYKNVEKCLFNVYVKCEIHGIWVEYMGISNNKQYMAVSHKLLW